MTAAVLSGLTAGAPVLIVDTAALADNWRQLSRRVPAAEVGANVKANAYGCGIELVVPALRSAGCRTFFVAHLTEAARVRTAAPDAIVYVLHGLPPGGAATLRAIDARPVLGSREEIAEWRATGGDRPAALHVDTGLNRLGLRPADALALRDVGGFDGVSICLLMTHFASSEVPDDPLNARQIAAFAAVRAAFSETPASLCNSSGLFLDGAPPYDLVRPGYALYGGNPTPGQPNPMRPVVRLEAPVVLVRDVPAGETIGYNGQWTAPSDRRIAVIALGYADGLDRRASATDVKPGGMALVGNRLCPIAARISMDLITVDVTGLPSGALARGDRVTLIGGVLDIDRVAAQIGTIGYEVLTHLAQRIDRRVGHAEG